MKIIITMVLLCCASIVKAQQTAIHFNQLDSLQKLKPKPVFVFIHTNWCSYCKAMDEVVFKDKTVAKLLRDEYYFVRLDAEEKSTITYANQKFEFKANKGVHDLAFALGNQNGKLAFPTSCILDGQNRILYQQHEFVKANELIEVLKHFTNKN
ncbi:thioredoxin family protein [Pedobacter sp. Hv1]|uniref:thioredoxin family protein n=1 Tax=Pedobacter sp. Hv1 TaxID=1740090 RepID=UPI0013792D70|nr:thioredoxin family protein [Pedobacter sp. Hv1]